MTLLLDDAANYSRMALLGGALVALGLARLEGRRGVRWPMLDRFALGLGLLSLYTFVNFGYFHGPGVVHPFEMFHYHLGAKYFPELGYDRLYGAALAADGESASPVFTDVSRIRDLASYEIVPAASVRGDPSFRARFDAERWEAFRSDLAVILALEQPARWPRALVDHGYNAPPSRTLLTGSLARAVGEATPRSLGLVASIDALLLAAFLVAVFRVYGLRSAGLCAVMFGANSLATYEWTGGSPLRLDWLVLSGFGVCALERRRFALAGVFLGAATMMRVFPAFFALGVVAQGLLEGLRTRSVPFRAVAFVAGFAASAAALFVASAAVLGLDAWLGFAAQVELHLEPQFLNNVGLRSLLDGHPLALAVARLGIAAAFLASLLRVSASQAAILGATLVYAFAYLSSYYYCLLVLCVLWQPVTGLSRSAWIFFSLLFLAPGVAAVVQAVSDAEVQFNAPAIYPMAALALLFAFVALYAHILVGSRRGRRLATAGVVALPLLLACGSEPKAPRTPPERPNLLLVTLDTTRADHLGLYGYGQDTSPRLDELGRDGVVHLRAYSTSSWTLPAHASLFTGQFPTRHGAMHDPEGSLILSAETGDDSESVYRANPLTPELPTLAEILADAGYATGAVVAGPWLRRVFGLARGFQDYDDAGANRPGGRVARSVSDSAIDWIERHEQEPFFLFLNYFDPHSPYDDPEGLERLFEDESGFRAPSGARRVIERYDGEIRYMDRHLGRVLDRLRDLGLYDHTWIIVTADHGEMHHEHGIFGHGAGLWEAELRVPLVVKPPRAENVPPGRSSRLVQLVDVLPMALDGMGLDPGAAGARDRSAFFAEVHPWRQGGPHWRAWLEGDWKLIWRSGGARALYNVATDPDEGHNLVHLERERFAAMSKALDAFVAELPRAAPAGPVRNVDAGTRRALESLGYLTEEGGGLRDR